MTKHNRSSLDKRSLKLEGWHFGLKRRKMSRSMASINKSAILAFQLSAYFRLVEYVALPEMIVVG